MRPARADADAFGAFSRRHARPVYHSLPGDWPTRFGIYDLAVDGVTAVSLEARGITRRAQLGRNASSLEADSLGGTGSIGGTLVVRLGKRATMRRPLHCTASTGIPRTLFRICPAHSCRQEDTAA